MKYLVGNLLFIMSTHAGSIQSVCTIDQDTKNEVRHHLNALNIAPCAARSLVKELVRAHLIDQFNHPERSPRCNQHHRLSMLMGPHSKPQHFYQMVDEEIERKLDEVYGSSSSDPIETIAQVFRLIGKSL